MRHILIFVLYLLLFVGCRNYQQSLPRPLVENETFSLIIKTNRDVYIYGEDILVTMDFTSNNDNILFNKTPLYFFKLKRDKDSKLILSTEGFENNFAPFPIFSRTDFISISHGESFIYRYVLRDIKVGKYSLIVEYILPLKIHDHVYDSGGNLVDVSEAWTKPLVSNNISFSITERPWKLSNNKGFELFTSLDLRTPLISQEDIISYDWNNHIIKVNSNGKNKFDAYKKNNRPSWQGNKFLVCIDGTEIYQGVFWSSTSSVALRCPVICDFDIENKIKDDEIQISFGYPQPRSPAFSKDKDPRNDQRIREVLQKAGKILDK